MLCEDLEGWSGVFEREVQEGGDICTLIVDSCCCTAETNIILSSNYPPVKNFKMELRIVKVLKIMLCLQ